MGCFLFMLMVRYTQEMENQQITSQVNTPNTPLPSPKPKSSKKKIALHVITIVIVAGLAFAIAYFWQQSKNDSTSAKLSAADAKIVSLEKQASEEPVEAAKPGETQPAAAVSTTTPDLIPGEVDNARNDGRVLITTIYKYSLNPTAVWVEYGTEPNTLNKETTKAVKGLAICGDNCTYATGQVSQINSTDLASGTVYYYRVAATINGQTQRSGVASFLTTK
jgi:flagellar basal body-associated protein FliL